MRAFDYLANNVSGIEAARRLPDPGAGMGGRPSCDAEAQTGVRGEIQGSVWELGACTARSETWMHELALRQGIVEIVVDRASKEGLHAVTRVVVEVGVDDALP